MQIRNDYEKDVFNGDIGTIDAIDAGGLRVRYDGRTVGYAAEELGALSLAYAISVHKSQGSEYPAVVMPLIEAHRGMLQRNLLYTAVTRATRLVFLVGTRRALALALKNDKPRRRLTRLAQRLASLGGQRQ